MNTFSVGEVISKAFDFAKKNLVYIAVLLVISLVPQITQTIGNENGISQTEITQLQDSFKSGDMSWVLLQYGNMISKSMTPLAALLGFILWLVQAGLKAGTYNSMIRVVKGEDDTFNIDAYKMPMNVYINYILTTLLVAIITAIGTIFCIIPGIYLAIKLMYAPMAILNDNELSVTDAIKASWNTTKNNFWSLILLYLANFGITIVGLLCCCIGVLFTNVIVQASLVIAFVTITGVTTAAKTNLYSASDED